MSVAPPKNQKVKQVSPETPLNIAKNLRTHKELKQRKGLLQGNQVDFFRYKRFIRALKSPEYTKLSQKDPVMYPEIQTEDDAKACVILLIKAQILYPVIKLHSDELKEHGLLPNKEFPQLIISNKAALQDDDYYVWNYNKKSISFYLKAIGVVSAIFALVCYPLWPLKMRIGVYYLSYAALGLVVAFFGLAILRLILYLITLPLFSGKGGFWIFPNLFEDCGVMESFKPFYGFGESQCYSFVKKQARKQRKAKRAAQKEETEDTTAPKAASTTALEKKKPVTSLIKKIEDIPE